MKRPLVALAAFLIIGSWIPDAVSAPLEKSAPKKPKKNPSKISPIKSLAPEKGVPIKEDDLGPITVFADVEKAWRGEKVTKILSHYGKGKVAIAIEGAGPTGGAFSKSQSHYLLKDLFKYTITEKFEFVQYRNVSDGRGKVYAVAEREYKRNDDGRLFKDKIYVSLHREGERWVISEIKSIR